MTNDSPPIGAVPVTALAVVVVATVTLASPAVAGPPYVTDDPEPVDYQHFEINTAAQGTYSSHGRSGALPGMDINYGLAPDVQFHVGLAAPFEKNDGQPLHYGYGDTEIGVKYRFVHEDDEGWRPQVAFYPNLELPTGDSERGLGSGYARAFLPLWLQKSFGAWTVDGGGGYWLNRHADNRNYWMAGFLVQRRITEDLSLGGEVFEQGKDSVDNRATGGFNLGGTYDIDEMNHILLSAGRGFRDADDTNTFSYYAGYQITF
jgi:hypothetical protein